MLDTWRHNDSKTLKSTNQTKKWEPSNLLHSDLPLQRCQGWAHNPALVFRDLPEFETKKCAKKMLGSTFFNMKLILNVLIPIVSTVGLMSFDLQTFKKKSPTGKQAYLLFISLSFCKNITTPILWFLGQKILHSTHKLSKIQDPRLSQGMYFGMVSSLRRMSTVASPPNSWQYHF